MELLLVIGILAIIFALGLPVAWDFYQQYQLDAETETLRSVLRQARNLAMINRNESVHGLYIDSSNFTVFQGSSYAARNVAEDRTFPRAGSVGISGSTEIVFVVLSGTTASSTYTLSNPYRQKNVYINSEGTVY